jgi:hypothetical protein
MKIKMLVLDAFQGYLIEKSGNCNFHINTDLVIIPTGMTSWPPKILPAWGMTAIWEVPTNASRRHKQTIKSTTWEVNYNCFE